MWLCTLRGFFSVVRKGTPPNNFQVRGRRRKDIENLCDIIKIPLSRIVISHDSDYEFRVKLNQAELGAMFDGLAATITYGNFKRAVDSQPDQKKQGATYHQWWVDHAAWQEHPPYSSWRHVDDAPEPRGGASDNAELPLPEVVRAKRGNGRKANRDDQ
jgi:hypothetical protein